jgi:hypothetical protein
MINLALLVFHADVLVILVGFDSSVENSTRIRIFAGQTAVRVHHAGGSLRRVFYSGHE